MLAVGRIGHPHARPDLSDGAEGAGVGQDRCVQEPVSEEGSRSAGEAPPSEHVAEAPGGPPW